MRTAHGMMGMSKMDYKMCIPAPKVTRFRGIDEGAI
jgi:hypothetical protein